MFRKVALMFGLFSLAGCISLPGGRPTGPEPMEGMVRTTLDNGLEVLLLEDHSAPVVALNVWVRVGSADERPEEAGMAHVFEHMLFKGTERRAVGEIASTVEAAGGNINAFTSYDMTVYHITMASRDAAVGIDVLADAVQHSALEPHELAREEEVILEEIRRGDDSPHRQMSLAVFGLAYENHPYRLPVIGTQESVKSFTRDKLLDFYHRWYVPANMKFVVVGDFDSAAVLTQIRAAFRDAPSREDLAHPRKPEAVQTQARAAVRHDNFEQTLLGLAYPITAFRDDDSAYLDLLSSVLGSGESSRLYRNIKDRLESVHAIGASAYTPLDPGLFFVDVTLEPEGIEQALAAIGSEIQRIRAFGPSNAELERARVNLLSSQVYEKETMQGQARKIGYYETLGGGIEQEAAYLERVRRATAADLERVAQAYLGTDHVNLVAQLPEAERPELDAAALLAAFRAGTSQSTVPAAEPLEAGIFRYRLPNGLVLIVKRASSVPLVSLRISFLGGLLAEQEDDAGISSFLAELVERGTEHRSAAQLAAEIEDIAGSVSGFSGRNSLGVTGEFMTDSLDTGLELFADVLLHPAFDPEELEKLRTERIAEIKRREDDLAHQAFELFSKELFGKHPYGLPALGTEKSIQALDRKALLDYYARYVQPSNGVLAIVGDIEPDIIAQTLASLLADWKGQPRVELPLRPASPPATELREASIEKHKAQVHIVVGFPGLALNDPDVPALEVLTQILSGQGGRLFLELRDKHSLAYSVTAFSIEGVDPGAFGVYIASSPDKLQESLQGLQDQLKLLLDQGIEAGELKRAQGYLIGTHAVALQRFAGQASVLSLDERYGLGATYHLGYPKRIEAVTIKDVERVARRLIDPDHATIAMVR